MKVRALSVVVLGLVTLWLLGCTPASATPTPAKAPTAIQATPTPAPVTGGTLKVAVREDPPVMDPHASSILGAYAPLLIYDNLLSLNEKGELAPDLAESWNISADGKEITFKLRKGVKFHDGTDFNAAAVKFNLERLGQPTANKRVYVVDVQSVDVVDDYTVKVIMKRASSPFLVQLSDLGGWIVSPAAVKKYDKDYGRNPVGTGPFQIEEWVKDNYHKIKRFDAYRAPVKTYLDGVIYYPIADATVRLANLRAGQMDWMHEVNPKDVDTIKASKDLVIYETDSIGWYRITFNNVKPPFDNKALRQAVANAIDREAIVKAVFRGHGKAAAGSLSPASWAYDPNLKGLGRDLAKAKAKLTEGGKPDGFEFTMLVINTEEYRAMAEVIQAQLADIGVKAKLLVQESAAALNALVKGEFEAGISMSPGWLEPDEDTYGRFHSKGASNYGRYANPKVDDLFEKARSTYNREERIKLYSQTMETIIEDATVAFLLYPNIIVAANQKVQNYKMFPPANYWIFKPLRNVWLKQ